ncbi:hypothetical protein CJU90_2019 [Yarrowia sp. C11]|nr:hypothetical protein CKK34_6047 [Yarrowia sp. E02]KAG5371951.1 hypothetical protein CJU90_2019 [Yarrowia sp. C11]
MFESILAGTVYTYKERSREASRDLAASSRDHHTDLFRVDPRMVADYFIRGKREKGKKFDIKAEKIGVVGQWLEAESRGMSEFEDMVKKQEDADLKKSKSKKKEVKEEAKEKEEEGKTVKGKEKKEKAVKEKEMFVPRDLKCIPGFSPLTPQLQSLSSHLEVMSSILAKKRFNSVKSKKADDVADSLLQALAWYNWQYNREYLRELLEDEDDERWLEVNGWVKENVE